MTDNTAKTAFAALNTMSLKEVEALSLTELSKLRKSRQRSRLRLRQLTQSGSETPTAPSGAV
jgi:hypothetical protein